MESARVGKRGAIIVPARLRKRFGIEEGSMVVAEEKDDGILIRPAVLVPVERYSPERKAEFLLSTATTAGDYQKARRAVRKLASIQIPSRIDGRRKWTVCFLTPTFFFPPLTVRPQDSCNFGNC